MNRVDKLRTTVSEYKRFTSAAELFIEGNEPFIQKNDVAITLSNNIVVSSHDLVKTKEILKYMRRATGHQFKLKNHFYSSQMIFVWESGFFQVWLYCDPDNIPDELMPSKSCEVIKVERPAETDYRIVCNTNGK